MFAAYAATVNAEDPLSALRVGELPDPEVPEGWATVRLSASSLNHHDLWSLKGVGLPVERTPMILGCDGVGVDENGDPVVVHAVIADPDLPDETLDPKRTLLSELHPGTLAERVSVPRRNLLPLPAGWTAEQAACLPTAWLTAYRMLTTRGRLPEGGSVLIQGAGGGVSTAAILLATAMGARVHVTSRDGAKRDRVTELGAHAYEPGARLPERVDVVIETVGAATFDHSVKCAKPGARIVVSGSTSGHEAVVDLRRVFFLQLEIVGSTMGTRRELADLLDLCGRTDVRPVVDSTYALADAADALRHLADGDVFGKIVLTHG
ncbi:zinc-binding dehydrogenase [Phytomonospora endophytica]|uniref:NADPH:quinone reductase-like Zn-dependent oxidoreductase n=1 Tax=Phytomonospora endophytica TaxID=714109 RepID=A0A841F9V9_9ACTN|nr:zinc-binding dehydrogenase [Phytomonospora endophytica]MBB6033036.1 NADPH:quinone reductase-like Zn-dependent oxidoreductase [Phytomonospora endophytica]GIG65263.1 Zn-dependent oxidoreductase [Phytomonospora endophytica]